MRATKLLSDQLDNWSDNEEKLNLCTPTAPQGSRAPITSPRPHPPRLTHRTLQALRQAWLQVRRRTRPWPQVLPLCNPTSGKASNGLCPSRLLRACHPLPCQLSWSERDPRRDLRDQPRAVTPKRGAIGERRERAYPIPLSRDRGQRGGNPYRQHASVSAASRVPNFGGSE